MLSLAMIRVEPGSTPGIGITITEHFFLIFRLLWDVFARGELVACHFAAAAVLEGFYDLPLLQILGFGGYILLHQARQCR